MSLWNCILRTFESKGVKQARRRLKVIWDLAEEKLVLDGTATGKVSEGRRVHTVFDRWEAMKTIEENPYLRMRYQLQQKLMGEYLKTIDEIKFIADNTEIYNYINQHNYEQHSERGGYDISIDIKQVI